MRKQQIDLIIHNASQLCTVPLHNDGPQRGHDLGDLGIIEDGAIAIHQGQIVETGHSSPILEKYSASNTIDANGKLVTPGLVDPHTHIVWAGERSAEFERRIAGATYQEIMAEGGGIASTMRHTRQASVDELVEQSLPRVHTMIAHGTTTLECKTGYGLSTDAELRQLEAIKRLNEMVAIDLVPTFLGAHAFPPEYKDDHDAYVDVVINESIPAVKAWQQENWPEQSIFCDVFCENGAFTLEQTERILRAGKAAGFELKIHADEFEPLGGTGLAVDLGATSVDHIVATTDHEIEMVGKSNTVATTLPPTPFGLGHHKYTPAQKFLDANAILAIATDCNPGTAWCDSLQIAFAIATRYLKLTQAQVLASATINSAYAVGLGGQVGTLTLDTLADVVIWQVDDYRYLGYRFGANLVDTVIKRGEIIHQREA